ncbi:phospholipase D-like domain-containing protein [Bordetella genomosp. 13]|uniref:phospholipase D-like domain-containing protein n=1 Tax=Bordetella genomosp. 13 TaxID=463040 RepID=UPI0011A6CE20|nr:phospholipase D-like domain-containing protein [Bordetella genomosp. 13]
MSATGGASFLTLLARCGAAGLIALLAACASVPDTTLLRERGQQAARSKDIGWQSYERGRDLASKHAGAQGAGSQKDFLAHHLEVEQAVSGVPLVAGNQVKLLEDGPTAYGAMLRAIGQAQRYVHMETYIFDDDEDGRRFVDALIAARQRNVEVALMVDAVGTMNTSEALFKQLRDAGVQVAVFNPLNPVEARAGWSPNERNHRKVLVVDGHIGYLGGMNISGVYSSRASSASGSGGGKSEAPWRDTHVEIRGPGVAQLEQVIRDGWASQKGPPLTEWITAAPPPSQGDLTVRILANQPDDADGYTVYLTMMSAFASARQSIHITMAYFAPDPAFVEVLADAARRGVDVAMVLPGFSDSSLVLYAGQSHYGDLLRAGVKIYERRDALLHAKTAVVDGVWSTVGSSNMDWRSFALNYEVNAVILGSAFGAEMEAMFKQDVANATPVDLQAWEDRGVGERVMEGVSRLFERWL